MKSHIRVALFATAGVFIMVGYQNCGNVKFNQVWDGALKSVYYNEGQCINGCWNNEINAQENVSKPDVNVVLVVDNSGSMAKIQARLGQGIRTLMDKLRNFNANFYLYSTTQSKDGTVTDVLKAREISSTEVVCEVTDGATNTKSILNSACPTTKSLNKKYVEKEREKLSPSLFGGVPLRIDRDTSEANFSIAKQKFQDAIVSVGISGSNDEQGICSLVKTVHSENDTNSIFSNSGSSSLQNQLAAFVVITDEDDHSHSLGYVGSDNKFLPGCLSGKEKRQDCTSTYQNPLPGQSCNEPSCAYYEARYSSKSPGSPIPNTRNFRYQTKEPDYNQLLVSAQARLKATFNQQYQYTTNSKITERFTYKTKSKYSVHRLSYTLERKGGSSETITWTAENKTLDRPTLSCRASCDADDIAAIKNGLDLNILRCQNATCGCAIQSCTAPSESSAKIFDRSASSWPAPLGFSSCAQALKDSNRISADEDVTACTNDGIYALGAATKLYTKTKSDWSSCAAATDSSIKAFISSSINNGTETWDNTYTPGTCTQNPAAAIVDVSFYEYPASCPATQNYCDDGYLATKWGSGYDKISCSMGACVPLSPETSAVTTRTKTYGGACPNANTVDCKAEVSAMTGVPVSKIVSCNFDSACAGGGNNPDITNSDVLTTIKVFAPSNPFPADCSTPYNYSDGTFSGTSIADYLSKKLGKTITSCSRSSASAQLYSTKTGFETAYQCLPEENFSFGYPQSQIASNAVDLSDVFVAKANQMFGSDYLVSAIISKPQDLNADGTSKCGENTATNYAPVSAGAKYESLVTKSGGRGVASSVCDSDYGIALSRVSNWVERTTLQRYKAPDVDPTLGHKIFDTWLVRDKARAPLKIGVDVEVRGNEIKFLKDGFIKAGDVIGYSVVKSKP